MTYINRNTYASENFNEALAYDLDYTFRFTDLNVENLLSSTENIENQKLLNIKVSKDRMRVLLSLDLPPDCPPFKSDEIESVLTDQGITTGIDEQKIHQLCQVINHKRQPILKELIAQGEEPVLGIDAMIKYHFNTESKTLLEEDDQGRINFKELNLINNVQEGDLLAEKISAVPPQSGINVYGRPVIPPPPKDVDFVAGNNTRSSSDGKQCFATIAGEAKLEKKMIHVSPVLTISGDVCLDTGNVTFNGTVQVFGDVRSGFYIKAKRDIIIHGMVESAELTAGGDIFIKNGIVAQHKGSVRCKGSLTVKHVDQAEVVCHGDMIVDSSILHSNITCYSRLRLPQGRIIGGHTTVIKNLEIGEIGTKVGVPTEITLGDKSIIQKRLHELKPQLLEKEVMLSKLSGIKNINTDQAKKLSEKAAENLRILLEKKQQITEEYQTLQSNIQKLEMLFRQNTSSRLKVFLKVFSNVTITIGHSKLTVNETITACCYFEDHLDQRVRIGPL